MAATGNEPFVQSFTNKFLDTDLEKTLKDHGITTLVMAGVSSNGAIIETSSEAAQLGFNVVVVLDATARDHLCRAIHRLAAGQRPGHRLAHFADDIRDDQILTDIV